MIINNWNNILENIPENRKDIYYLEQYHDLYINENERKKCYYFNDNNNIYLFPFLIKRINNTEYYDFETVYGYGGPITNSEDIEFIKRASDNMLTEFYKQNIIAGFIRYHPILNNYKLLSDISQPIYDRKTVCIFLEKSEEEIWKKEIHSKHRNVIRKAESNKLEFIVDEEFEYLKEFEKLYNETMKNKEAEEMYYWRQGYFDELRKNLKNIAIITAVKHDEKIISAAIILKYGKLGHYHLAGNDTKYLKLYPNNFLIYKAAVYLKSIGVKYFHLGGGSDNKEDNQLYKFKKRFSSEFKEFYIGKILINNNKYKEFCDEWEVNNPDKIEKYSKYFLKYRN